MSREPPIVDDARPALRATPSRGHVGTEHPHRQPHGQHSHLRTARWRQGWRRHHRWFIVAFLLALTWWSADALDVDLASARDGWENLGVISGDAWPPDLSVIRAEADEGCWTGLGFFCSRAWDGLLETLQIAFLATVFSLLISLPLAMLAATNLSPRWVSVPVRTVLAAIRVMPSLLWAILFVILVGFGPFAGVLAMTLYSIGYLTKLQYEAVEGLSSVPLEAAEAMGLSAPERVRWVVIPEAANSLLSQALFMLDYNVRASTIIGVVGAGGIGFLIRNALGFFLYDRVMTYLLVIFVTVLLLEWLSAVVRRGFTDEARPRRASWGSVVRGMFTGGAGAEAAATGLASDAVPPRQTEQPAASDE